MWKPAIQPTRRPTPVSHPDPAPPANTFIPRPIVKRQKLFEGRVFNVQWGRGETHDSFFADVRSIIACGGITTKSQSDPSITHYLIAIPERYPLNEPFNIKDLGGEHKWQHVIKDHGRWYDPSSRCFDQERNRIEGRGRVVLRREWLGDVLSGRLRVGEEGRWGVCLKSDGDLKLKSDRVSFAPLARPDVTRKATDPRIKRPSTLLRLDTSCNVTPSPLATPRLESNIVKASSDPRDRNLSKREVRSQYPPSSPPTPYLATPCSATSLSKPEMGVPPRSHLDFIHQQDRALAYTSTKAIMTQTINGFFTPPPSASPPPGIRSPEYIMIPRSPFPIVRPAGSEPPGMAASPIYSDQDPSHGHPLSPSYYDSSSSIVQTPRKQSPSYLTVTLSPDNEFPISEISIVRKDKNENEESSTLQSEKVSSGDLASMTSRSLYQAPTPTNRQVSFETAKRPRPPSPIGGIAIERPLAKRRSLQGMRGKSRSRSGSPLTPSPSDDEDGEAEEEEDEEDMDIDSAEEEDKDEEEAWKINEYKLDSERGAGNDRSPSPLFSGDSDSDSDMGLEPELETYLDDMVSEPSLIANTKGIEEVDLLNFDLQAFLVDCDIIDDLVEIMEI